MDILNDIKQYLKDNRDKLEELYDKCTLEEDKQILRYKWYEAIHIQREISLIIEYYLANHKED